MGKGLCPCPSQSLMGTLCFAHPTLKSAPSVGTNGAYLRSLGTAHPTNEWRLLKERCKQWCRLGRAERNLTTGDFALGFRWRCNPTYNCLNFCLCKCHSSVGVIPCGCPDSIWEGCILNQDVRTICRRCQQFVGAICGCPDSLWRGYPQGVLLRIGK